MHPLSERFLNTGDNRTEFAEHRKIADELEIDFYFTHPYSSWEKDTNENTSRLIRQYFPKGTDFNGVSDEAIMIVENELNDRRGSNEGSNYLGLIS